MKYTNIAKEVIAKEATAISGLSHQLDENFEQAVSLLSKSKGKLIVTGIGKSGLIGQKIAATLASTGTPSFFIHPTEAYHGDLGMIEPCDAVLLISYSGETDELLRLVPFLAAQNNITISMTGNSQSTLANNTKLHLSIHIEKEACPLSLAPTSSTTAALVMGDALAVALMQSKDFKNENFAKFHPGGTLGRRLLTTVKDVMTSDNLPMCVKSTGTKEIISLMSNGKLGLVIVLDNTSLLGVITDGDIRRAMDAHEKNFFDLQASHLLNVNPKSIEANAKLTDAHKSMTKNKINSLIVTDNNKVIGVVQLYDLGV